MKGFLAEEGSSLVLELLSEHEPPATSRISYVECHAAFARGRREGRLNAREVSSLVRGLRSRWEDLVVVELDGSLGERAAEIAHEHALRASDAIQLASATWLDEGPAGLRFLCWDRMLRDAARGLGFTVIPEAIA